MRYLLLAGLVIWIYFLTVLRRGKLGFWYFLVGSAGMFLFLLLFIQPFCTKPLTDAVAVISGILGKLSGFYQSYFQYGVLFINSKSSCISLFIDYECSGIIEIMAFTSMLWFFPVYQTYEKAILSILGILWIFGANVLRIFVICTLIYYWGNNIFYFAHTIFGRLVFYGLSIALYFHVFTRPQIIRQKIGSFHYENH